MKIFLCNNFLYQRGGAEKVFMDEVAALTEIGHQTVVFSRKHYKNKFVDLEGHFPPEMNWETGSIWEKAKTAMGIVYSKDVYLSMRKLLRKHRPDVVHLHNIYARLTTAVIDAASEMGLPIVMTLHDYKLICPTYFMLSGNEICERCKGHRYYNAVFQRCHKGSLIGSSIYALETSFNAYFKKYEIIDRFISPSGFLISKHDWRIPAEKFRYIPNALDLRNYNLAENNLGYILFAGRLSKEKGLATLMEAIRDTGWPVVLAGEGPMGSFVKERIGKPGWKNVSLAGHLEGERLANLYRGAKLVLFPSEWYENAPMSILESYAYGKPVIGARLGGVAELIQDEVTGLLFEPTNVNDLRDKIKYIMDQPARGVEMGLRGRRWIEEKFDMRQHVHALEMLYEEIISQKRSGIVAN